MCAIANIYAIVTLNGITVFNDITMQSWTGFINYGVALIHMKGFE